MFKFWLSFSDYTIIVRADINNLYVIESDQSERATLSLRPAPQLHVQSKDSSPQTLVTLRSCHGLKGTVK